MPLEAGRQTIRFNVTHEGWNINYATIALPVEVPSYESVSIYGRWNSQYLYDDNSDYHAMRMRCRRKAATSRSPGIFSRMTRAITPSGTMRHGNYMVNDGSGYSGMWRNCRRRHRQVVLRTVDGYFKINSS